MEEGGALGGYALHEVCLQECGQPGPFRTQEHWPLELSSRQAVCQGCRADHKLESLMPKAGGIVPGGMISMKPGQPILMPFPVIYSLGGGPAGAASSSRDSQ